MNAMALNSIPTAAPRGSFGVYLKETQYELIRMVRNPGIAVPVLVLPLGLYLLFAFVIGGEWIA
jgi:ABC-2 type transport system permease protein